MTGAAGPYRCTGWAVLFVFALAFAHEGAARASDSAQDEGKRLEDMRVELQRRRDALKDLDNAKRSLVASLGELDESLALLAKDGDAARVRLEVVRADLVAMEEQAAREEGELVAAKQRLAARMRVLYVGGEGGTARALLGAEGFAELALRRRFLTKLAESDAKLVTEIARIEKSVREQRERARMSTIDAEVTQKTIEEQRELMAAVRAERQAAVARISSERSLARRQARELEHQRAALSIFLRNLVEDAHRRELSPVPASRAELRRMKLAWPVEGMLIRKFGVVVDKDSRAEIVSNGIELRAEEGAPIVAVADGRIAHVGWMRGFGQVVIVDHGAGHHTISAHIQRSSVARGDEVKRGQTIAFVGDTESTNGPKLYFELRENGRPRDPMPHLRHLRQ